MSAPASNGGGILDGIYLLYRENDTTRRSSVDMRMQSLSATEALTCESNSPPYRGMVTFDDENRLRGHMEWRLLNGRAGITTMTYLEPGKYRGEVRTGSRPNNPGDWTYIGELQPSARTLAVPEDGKRLSIAKAVATNLLDVVSRAKLDNASTVYSFCESVKRHPSQPAAQARETVRSLTTRGTGTALYDAVVAAAGEFSQVDGRVMLIVLTDGADNGSKASHSDAHQALCRFSAVPGHAAFIVGINDADAGELSAMASADAATVLLPGQSAEQLQGAFVLACLRASVQAMGITAADMGRLTWALFRPEVVARLGQMQVVLCMAVSPSMNALLESKRRTRDECEAAAAAAVVAR
jgi:hypothetical protein